MTRHRTTIGAILLVLGIGLTVAVLPDALGVMVHGGYFSDGGQLAVGAMMLASGWFLRRPSTHS